MIATWKNGDAPLPPPSDLLVVVPDVQLAGLPPRGEDPPDGVPLERRHLRSGVRGDLRLGHQLALPAEDRGERCCLV